MLNQAVFVSLQIIFHFGELGTSCFFLASGYYLEDMTFKPEKPILLLLQVEYYILLAKGILTIFGRQTLWRFQDFFPLFHDEYWFIHVYLLIYILTPFLKKMVAVLDELLLQKLILSQLIIWSFLPTIVYSTVYHGNTESMPYYNRYVWFLVIFMLGYYLRKYRIPIPKHDWLHLAEAKRWTKLVFPFELLILFIIMGERGLWPFRATFFWTPNLALMVIMSVAMFISFRDWKPRKYRRWSEIAASTTLGIYLLHDGELRSFLWRDLFACDDSIGFIQYVIKMIFVVTFVFFTGMAVDLIRRVLEKRTVIPFIQSLRAGMLKGRRLHEKISENRPS